MGNNMNTIKFSCNACGRNYYLEHYDAQKILPADIEAGDAFPMRCPICGEGYFGILIKDVKNSVDVHVKMKG
jgi:hypothetical protein